MLPPLAIRNHPEKFPGAPKPAEGARLSRLDLANWIVSRGNPLTARAFVNRLWKQFYGIGIAKSLEDVGTQGDLPINQPLLDWLAVDFMESGWDVKHLVRLMVTSVAYRQGSNTTKEMLKRDPANREIARDPESSRDGHALVAGVVQSGSAARQSHGRGASLWSAAA